MRRTLLTLAILGLIWISYMALSVYDLFVLIRAIETRDVNAVTRRGYSTRCAFRSPNQVRRLNDYIEVASLDLSEIAPPIQK